MSKINKTDHTFQLSEKIQGPAINLTSLPDGLDFFHRSVTRDAVATLKTFTTPPYNEIIQNGWLHTGDIGEIDATGCLKITDRKKDIIVSHGGDNISPSKIENFFCNNEKIKQCLVYGDKKNYLVALIVVDKNAKDYTTIRSIVDNLNKSLSILEKVKKFKLIDEEFTIDNGLMTPTLKLKRKKIIEKYKQDLEKLYS